MGLLANVLWEGDMQGMEWRDARLDWDRLPENPMDLFADWHATASLVEPWQAGAMVLATASAAGEPSARVVLLRGFGTEGLRFFTNYDSVKGQHLADNPRYAAVFWWPSQVRQIRFQGVASRLARGESEAYFAGRPRGSQLGAWSSPQSQPIPDLAYLQAQHQQAESAYADGDVPCPQFWGGYLLQPDRVEFWQGGKDRLHDRVLYMRSEADWVLQRIAP